MSQILKLENNEVRYVLDNSELVLDSSDLNEDIIYSDGTRAILVNGHIIQGDAQTIVLQEGDDLTQYYINDDSEQILVTDENEMSGNSSLEEANIVQYIEEDDNSQGQVVYITNDDEMILPDDICETYNVENVENEGGSYTVKEIELGGEVVDIDDIIQQQNDGETTIIQNSSGYQYAVLKDGKLHIQTLDAGHLRKQDTAVGEDLETSSAGNSQNMDLSKITGRNLLTGQTVTLHSYIDKLQKKNMEMNNTSEMWSTRKKNDLGDLLNKKIPLCKTVNGKKLVGKIIHIERNPKAEAQEAGEEVAEETVQETSEVLVVENADAAMENVEEEDNALKVTEHMRVGKDEEEQISRTLSGIMTMESVKRKLLLKNVVVKVLEKIYTDQNVSRKKITYSLGYMEDRSCDMEEERWVYVPQEVNGTNSKYRESVHITIQMTASASGERKVKVLLNDEYECRSCFRKFANLSQSRAHARTCPKQKSCVVCDESFDDMDALHVHFQAHVREGKYVCTECGKVFASVQRLKRHRAVHSVVYKSLECTTCLHRCSNEATLKKHLMTHLKLQCKVCLKKFANANDLNYHKRMHDVNNYFQCYTCGRSFSRYSNLMRHVEIHRGEEALYQCDICGASYHYISSLTRHIVQNHIPKDDNPNQTTAS